MKQSPFSRAFGVFRFGAHSAGRASNPRLAFPSLSPWAGFRAAGELMVPDPVAEDNFTATHVPQLYAAEIAEFGRVVDYWVDGDPAQSVTITVIWKDGAEDETTAPGRYSHIEVQHSDLPQDPTTADMISRNGVEYSIVDVQMHMNRTSTLVLENVEI